MNRGLLSVLVLVSAASLTSCSSARVVLPQEVLEPLATLVVELNFPGVTVEVPFGLEPNEPTQTAPVDDLLLEDSLPGGSATETAPAMAVESPVSTVTSESATDAIVPTATFVPPTATRMPSQTATSAPTAAIAPPTATQAPSQTATKVVATSTTVSSGSGCEVAGNGSFESQVVALINQERSANGLPALKANSKLTGAARGHSQDMACNGFFNHVSPSSGDPSDRIWDAGYSFSWMGENIAAGYGSAAETVEGWMNSPGHRANILSANFTEIGIGYAYLAGSPFGSYITAVFAAP